MNTDYSLVDAFQFLYARRKKIGGVVLIVFLASAGVSLLMPNYYKSETIFYAASPDLADPIPIGGTDKNIRIYGDDTDLDRLFTIASSYELIHFIIDSFDLYKHYGIDSTDAKASFKVREKFLENYQSIKTKYRALQLSIEDKDPAMAATMVNAARNKIEDIAQKIVKEGQRKLLANYEANMIKKQLRNDSLSAKMVEAKAKYNILELGSQAEIYTSIITRTEGELQLEKGKLDYFVSRKLNKDSINKYASVVMGLQNRLTKIKSEMEVYYKNVTPIRQIENELWRNIDQLNVDKERHKQLLAAVNAPFKALHLVESGQVPVQKSRPKRSVWVLLATFLGFVSFSLYLLLREIYKNEYRNS